MKGKKQQNTHLLGTSATVNFLENAEGQTYLGRK